MRINKLVRRDSTPDQIEAMAVCYHEDNT